MGHYCTKCGDKLEVFTVVKTITGFDSGGFLDGGKIKWDNKGMASCDNEDCEFYGVVVVGADDASSRKKSSTAN